ncbi:MAG: hypothetical protein ACI8S6_001328 [Myxococcota bacterium]|jgi:hypothetical protein
MIPIVGLGLHRPMTAAELAPIAAFRPLQHDPDDVVDTAVVDGIPGAVSRHVAGADLSISVGIAELHQYAGISGGHKGVAVGCGGRATISALHHRDRVCAPGIQLGRLDGNPFRAAIDQLGVAARCTGALLYVPSVDRWLFGDPIEVVAEAARLLSPWRQLSRLAPGALLRVPAVKAVSLYQASRAATYLALSPHPPLTDGATIAIEAACPEGLGAEAGFVRALSSSPPPWSALLTGPAPTGAGAQRAVMLALLARRYRFQVVGCPQAAALRAVGIDAQEAPAGPLPPGWIEVDDPFHALPQHSPDTP